MSNTSFQELFGISHTVVVRINVTNMCNLHCDYCDHGCHIPFSKDSSKLFRKNLFMIQPEEIEKYCHVLAGIGERDLHLLQGGEITVLPVDMIVRYIEIFYAYGRKVGLRTNGYNLTGIPIGILNQLEFIFLNSHGTNQEAINHCYDYLTKHYVGKVIMEQNYHHRDLDSLVNHGIGTIEQGLKCDHLLSTLTSIPPVIYPCCNGWALMNALNSSSMRDALVDAGWTLNNPRLIETFSDWRQTLPSIFFKAFCADSCYESLPSKEIPMHRIKSHQNDRIMKG